MDASHPQRTLGRKVILVHVLSHIIEEGDFVTHIAAQLWGATESEL